LNEKQQTRLNQKNVKKKGQEKRKENRYRRVLQSQQSMIAGSVMIYQSQLTFVAHNLFVTSKNETTNSPIHEFKVLHKGQSSFQNPFLKVYYYLFINLKPILSLAFSF